MLILPLIDLLILSGTGLLVLGLLLKVVDIATVYNPAILGFSSMDFVVMTGICWGFALVLAARSWVKLNEPNLMTLRREQVQAQARRQAQQYDLESSNGNGEPAAKPVVARAASEGGGTL